MSLILPANSLTGGYEIDNSLRFEDSSTDYLSRTLSSNNTSATTMTFSWWHKVGDDNDANWVYTSNTTDAKWFRVGRSSVGLFVYYRDASFTNQMDIKTNALYRDSSAWYHFVVAIDTTQATASNRVKTYVNGVEITSFSSAVYPSQNYTFDNVMYTSGNDVNIGRSYVNNTPTQFFSGYLSEYYFIDGQALTPTDFGEFDDSGIWKPIDVSGLTFGTNGFYLPFENSGALGQDDSGNGNNFTVNNLTSIDQVTDTPTNNFATLNPLYPNSGTGFSEGNLKYTYPSALWRSAVSTIGTNTGKWFTEINYTSGPYGWFGVCGSTQAMTYTGTWLGDTVTNATGIAFGMQAGEVYSNGSLVYATGSGVSVGTKIGIALDLDNGYIYFAKNGVWINSGVPTSGASGTGGFALPNRVSSEEYLFGVSSYAGTESESNFGNPTFTIASGNSDANGYGNFEYAVPSGYYSLCTKNLAEFG